MLNIYFSFFLIFQLQSIKTIFAKQNDAVSTIPKQCLDHFKSLKLNDSCSINCNALNVDMSNFNCSEFCDKYCNQNYNAETSLIRISELYPGLTGAEKKLVDKNPQQAIKAYLLSWKAEKVCKTIYFKSDTNNESDACRHFMWAALLNLNFGMKISNDYLDAHESNLDQSESERSMDLANNRRGLIISNEMIKQKKIKDEDFLNQFKEDLKNNKLIILKKRSI